MRILLIISLFCVISACKTTQSHEKSIAHYRQEKIKENTTGPRHPLEPGDETNLRFFETSKSYRVVATVSPAKDTTQFDMQTYSGKTKKYRRYAVLSFTLNGAQHQLTVYQSPSLSATPEYKDYLFLPFKDLSNGEETYGGGRYLDLKTTDIQDGRFILDFNKVYNPWCAYSDGYNCPVPPKENHLNISVLAGEKQYVGEKRHQ